jgi:F-type H+-transporting ATPase subunit delta
VPLTGAQQNALTANLARRYGPGLNFLFSHNPALLGGLRVKVGSDVYDDSVQERLNALRESF